MSNPLNSNFEFLKIRNTLIQFFGISKIEEIKSKVNYKRDWEIFGKQEVGS